PVEAILVAELRGPLRRKRLITRKDRDRVARDQVEHEKAQHRDSHEHRDGLQQALRDIGQHGTKVSAWYEGVSLSDRVPPARGRSARPRSEIPPAQVHGDHSVAESCRPPNTRM